MSAVDASVLRILYAEDSRVDSLLTQTLLGKIETWTTRVDHVETLHDTVLKFQSSSYDLILLDLTLPDSSHEETVKKVQENAASIPIIVLTSDDDLSTITGIMRMGVQDYLVKGNIDADRLSRSIRYAINNKRVELENEKYQSQLVESQKLEAIGRLAAGIAHDINTPTQFVGGNLKYVKTACTELKYFIVQLCEQLCNVHQSETLDVIRRAKSEYDVDNIFNEVDMAIEQSIEGVNRIDGIVRSINQYVHPSNQDLRCINLNQEIENIIMVTRHEWEGVAEVTTELDANLPELECFPDLIGQVFLNMVVNASQAIEEKNEVKFGKGSIKISSYAENGCAKVSVEDSGIGISEEHQSSVFEPFFTTKGLGVGTGQGLSQAYKSVVKIHKGSIDLESEPGVGSKFIISIPTNLSAILCSSQ